MKQSQAFAAFRQSLITDKQHAIINELVPEFNSRCEDIRRKVEVDFDTYKNRAKADNFKKSLTYDLVLHRNEVIRKVQEDLTREVNHRLAEYGARLDTEEVPHPKKEGRMQHVKVAHFPDGSKARVPNGLWIDYAMFDRV